MLLDRLDIIDNNAKLSPAAPEPEINELKEIKAGPVTERNRGSLQVSFLSMLKSGNVSRLFTKSCRASSPASAKLYTVI